MVQKWKLLCLVLPYPEQEAQEAQEALEVQEALLGHLRSRTSFLVQEVQEVQEAVAVLQGLLASPVSQEFQVQIELSRRECSDYSLERTTASLYQRKLQEKTAWKREKQHWQHQHQRILA